MPMNAGDQRSSQRANSNRQKSVWERLAKAKINILAEDGRTIVYALKQWNIYCSQIEAMHDEIYIIHNAIKRTSRSCIAAGRLLLEWPTLANVTERWLARTLAVEFKAIVAKPRITSDSYKQLFIMFARGAVM